MIFFLQQAHDNDVELYLIEHVLRYGSEFLLLINYVLNFLQSTK